MKSEFVYISVFLVVRYQLFNQLIIKMMSLTPINHIKMLFCLIINFKTSIYKNHPIKTSVSAY